MPISVQTDAAAALSSHAASTHPPAGSILMYGGTAAPSGWLMCAGAAVSRTTYAALFAVVGTAFGVGDGSTTFNLPDLQGRFPLGKAAAGTGSTLGGTGGALDHTHTSAAHTHTQPTHTHAAGTLTSPTSGAPSATITAGAGSHTHSDPVAGDTGTPSATVSPGSATHTHAGGTVTGSTAAGGNDATGSTTPSDTGVGNPAFQAVNFIIAV